MPAVFNSGVNSVGNNEAEGIFEYEGGDFERNAMVLLLILEVLGRVPAKLGVKNT